MLVWMKFVYDFLLLVQVSSLGSAVQKDTTQRQVRSDDLTQHAPQVVSRKAVRHCSLTVVSRLMHCAAVHN